ncbi:unnamed protein product [Prorocentrum cordatum]|uniref:protein-tyrosine-phosphatase n=1 Tax=Prorocentrum cordatum TaxID=2364126 RepID=A0ABN9S707_9DINO|nr:unnamed protein product [Polarella glacialis]
MASLKEVLAARRKAWTSSEILTLEEAEQLRPEACSSKAACPHSSQSAGVRIFLGPGRDAQNLEQLRAHNVTHILNCADDVPNYHETAEPKIVYERLEIVDFGNDAGSGRTFRMAIEFCRSVLLESWQLGNGAGDPGDSGLYCDFARRPDLDSGVKRGGSESVSADPDATFEGSEQDASRADAEHPDQSSESRGACSDQRVGAMTSSASLSAREAESSCDGSLVTDPLASAGRCAILIHCANGSNRSVTVACAVLMALRNLRLNDAWEVIKARRPQALPLQDNQQQLLEFDKKLFRVSQASMTKADFYRRANSDPASAGSGRP